MTIIGDATLIEIFSALGTPIIAVFAFLAYLLNRRLEKDNRRLQKLEKEPHVVAYLWQESNYGFIVDLVIANVGKGPAFNIKISIDPSDYSPESHGVVLPRYKNKSLTTCLPQGEKVRTSLGTGYELLTSPKKFNHTALLSYENFDGATKSSSHLLDVMIFESTVRFDVEGEKEIAEGVKKIADMMEEVIRGNDRINVETMSKREADKKWQEELERYQKQREQQESKNNG